LDLIALPNTPNPVIQPPGDAVIGVLGAYLPPRTSEVLVVGAGCARVVTALLAKGFKRLHILERELWSEGLTAEHRHGITAGRLEVHLSEYTAFQPVRRFGAIIWMAGDMGTLPPARQQAVLTHLKKFLAPGGRLIVDLPQTRARRDTARHLPLMDQMITLGKGMGFSPLEIKLYRDEAGAPNALYAYRKPAA